MAAISFIASLENARQRFMAIGRLAQQMVRHSGISSVRSASGGDFQTHHVGDDMNRSSRNSPRAVAFGRSRWVAEIIRTSISISRLLPSGRALRSCRTRSSFTCKRNRHIADLVEKQRTYPQRHRNNPSRLLTAPVKAPRVAKQFWTRAAVPAARRS